MERARPSAASQTSFRLRSLSTSDDGSAEQQSYHVPVRSWFKHLFGVPERNYEHVRKHFTYDEATCTLFTPNGPFIVGQFSRPSVRELRFKTAEYVPTPPSHQWRLVVKHIKVTDIMALHGDPQYANATFQAASQFNCLEFPGPAVMPEMGITDYHGDYTQGPSCALATAPAALFRNYFVQVKPGSKERGQSSSVQLNNLEDVEAALGFGHMDAPCWEVKNGYTRLNEQSLLRLNQRLENDPALEAQIVENLRVGVQRGAQVVFRERRSDRFHLMPKERRQLVNQVFCSAMSLSRRTIDKASIVAPRILQGCYEATLRQALVIAEESAWEGASHKVVLTFVGGGVFGNDMRWICDAIVDAITAVSAYPLEVHIAHFRSVDVRLQQEIDELLKQNGMASESSHVEASSGPMLRSSSIPFEPCPSHEAQDKQVKTVEPSEGVGPTDDPEEPSATSTVHEASH